MNTSLVLPTLNAILNATSATLLLIGFFLIRAKKIALHAVLMVAAMGVSVLFLISYIIYHLRAGVVHFQGTGWVRPFYFALLLSHTVLAVVIVPLAVWTMYLAARQRYPAHVAIARWTFPLWLYVSVTGVVVYWMLYHWPSVR